MHVLFRKICFGETWSHLSWRERYHLKMRILFLKNNIFRYIYLRVYVWNWAMHMMPALELVISMLISCKCLWKKTFYPSKYKLTVGIHNTHPSPSITLIIFFLYYRQETMMRNECSRTFISLLSKKTGCFSITFQPFIKISK